MIGGHAGCHNEPGRLPWRGHPVDTVVPGEHVVAVPPQGEWGAGQGKAVGVAVTRTVQVLWRVLTGYTCEVHMRAHALWDIYLL